MSISDNQKLDFLWKKLGYGATKTDINSVKTATNESIPSPLLLSGTGLWTDAYQIPTLIPSASSHIVEIYDDTGNGSASVETTEDTTATPNRTWKTGLTNWIPPQFGSTYAVKVYIAPAGTADPQTSGTRVFAAGSGNNDEFFFDYQSGVLNFIGTNLPAGIDGNEIFIVGGRYIGKTGNRFTALYADSADIGHAFIDSADIGMADIITAYIDSADILHAIIDSADITLGRINTAYIDSADIGHAFIDSAEIGILNITGQINGPETFIIDPAAVGDNTGRVIIKGDLQVDGTETIVNSTTVTVNDKNIVLADSAQDSSQADGAGITVFAANAKITYEAAQDRWVFNKDVDAPALYADSGIITYLTSTYGTIQYLTSDSATIGNITSTNIDTVNLDADSGTITNLHSSTGVIVNLTSSNGVITVLASNYADIDSADIDQARILKATVDSAGIQYADIDSADIDVLRVKELTVDRLYAGYADIDSADIDVLRSLQVSADSAGIKYADIDSADIELAKIVGLNADSANITKLTSFDADVTDLFATQGVITTLISHFADIDSAEIELARITGLTADSAHITGNLTVGGDLTVAGNATIRSDVGGNIYLGDSNEDNIVFSADINSHLIPNTTETFDLGSLDKRWREIYLSGQSVYLGGLILKESDGKFVVYDSSGQLTDILAKDVTAQTLNISDSAFIQRFSADSAVIQYLKVGQSLTVTGDGLQSNQITTDRLNAGFADIDSAEIDVLRAGNLTISGNGITTPYISADSADISVLRIDSGNFEHVIIDSADINGAYIDSATIRNLYISGSLSGVGLSGFIPSAVGVMDAEGSLTSDSGLTYNVDTNDLTVQNNVIAKDVKITSLYPGYILTSGANDSVGFTEGLKYGNHTSDIISNDGFATSFQKLYDSGYYRFNIDDNTGKLINTGDVQLGRFTGAAFGTYYAPSYWVPPTNISEPRDFYGLEIFTDSAKLVSTAHTNIFKSSLNKDGVGADSNIIEVLSREDSTLFEIRKDGSINFTGDIYKNGDIFTGGGIFIKDEPSGDAAYNIDPSNVTDTVALALKLTDGVTPYAYGRVAIGTDTPKYKLDVVGDISVRGQIDSNVNWAVLKAGAIAPTFNEFVDESDGSRFSYITPIGATRGGYFRGGLNGDYHSNNIGLFSTAFGEATRAAGIASFAVGSLTEAGGNYSIALGKNARTNGANTGAILIGTDATVDSSTTAGFSNYSIGIGYDVTVFGTNALAIGAENSTNGNQSGIFGYNNNIGTSSSRTATAGSYAIGTGNTVKASGSYVIGSNNTLKGNPSFAFGGANVVEGANAFSIGIQNSVYGPSGIAIGTDIRIDSSASNAIGINLNASNSMNVADPRILSIQNGNVIIGDSDQKFSNDDGNLYVKGDIILAGEVLQEGAPGVFQSTTPFVDGGTTVTYAVLDPQGEPKPLGINIDPSYSFDVAAQDGFAVSGTTDGSFTITDSALIDSAPFIGGADQNFLVYLPALEAFRVGKFTDYEEQLANDKIGLGSIALGKDNSVSGLYSTALGNNNTIPRGGDASLTSTKGSYITFLGNNNILDSEAVGSNNYVLGEDNLIKGSTTDTVLIGRNITATDLTRQIIMKTANAGDSAFDNTKVAIGKDSAAYALDVRGTIRVDSGATMYFGSKTIQDYLGFGVPQPVGAGFGSGAAIANGIDSIQFDHTIGAINNVARVRVPYDHQLYIDPTMAPDLTKAIQLDNIPLSELTSKSGNDLDTIFYFADPIDSFQFALRRDSHEGPPVISTGTIDSNISIIDGFDFGDSGDVIIVPYTAPRIISPDLNVAGNLIVGGDGTNLRVDSNGLTFNNDLAFTSKKGGTSFRFDSAGITVGGSFALGGNSVTIGGLSFDSHVIRPGNLLTSFIDTDYVQERFTVDANWVVKPDALVYNPSGIKKIILGGLDVGNLTSTQLLEHSFATDVRGNGKAPLVFKETTGKAIDDALGQSPINIINSAGVARAWPNADYLSNIIDPTYINSRVVIDGDTIANFIDDTYVKSIVDSAYILSAANDSSEWQRTNDTLFFGTYPNVQNVKVGIGTDNPQTKFHVTGVGRFDSGLTVTGGPVNISGTQITVDSDYFYQITPSILVDYIVTINNGTLLTFLNNDTDSQFVTYTMSGEDERFIDVYRTDSLGVTQAVSPSDYEIIGSSFIINRSAVDSADSNLNLNFRKLPPNIVFSGADLNGDILDINTTYSSGILLDSQQNPKAGYGGTFTAVNSGQVSFTDHSSLQLGDIFRVDDKSPKITTSLSLTGPTSLTGNLTVNNGYTTTLDTLITNSITSSSTTFTGPVVVDSSTVSFTFDSNVTMYYGPGSLSFDSNIERIVDSNYIGNRLQGIWSFNNDAYGNQQIYYDDGGAVVIGEPADMVAGDSDTKLFVKSGNVIFRHGDWDSTGVAVTTTGVIPDFSTNIRYGDNAGARLMWIPQRGAFRVGAVDGVDVDWGDEEVGRASVGIGYNTRAADYSIALGYDIKAGNHVLNKINSVSIGHTVNNQSDAGVAVGSNISHSQLYSGSVSIGEGIVNNNTNSGTAIGKDISTNSGVSIGKSVSTTVSTGGVSIGYNQRASNGSVSIGKSSGSNFGGGLSIGSSATSNNSTTIGRSSSSSTGGLSIGISTSASNSSVSIGNNVSSGTSGISIGSSNSTSQGGIAIGRSSSASRSSVSLGASNSTGNSNIAIGKNNISTDLHGINVAIGYGNNASSNTVAIGYGNSGNGYVGRMITVGYNNTGNVYRGTIFGRDNTGNSSSYRGGSDITIFGRNNKNNTSGASITTNGSVRIFGSDNDNNAGSHIFGSGNDNNQQVNIFGNSNDGSADGNGGYIYGSGNTITRYGMLYGANNTAVDIGYAFGVGNTTANGGYSYGKGNTTTLGEGYAFGYNNTVDGTSGTDEPMAFGHSNSASSGGIAFGENLTVSNGGIAVGANSTASAFRSLAIGSGITVSGQNSVGIGLSSSTSGSVIENNTLAIMGGKVAIGQASADPAYQVDIYGNVHVGVFGDYWRHGKRLTNYIQDDVVNDAYVKNIANSTYVQGIIDIPYLRSTMTSQFFFYSDAISNDLYTTTSGSVGIGRQPTNSSKYKLDVDGSINYTGKLYLNGDLLIPSEDSLGDVYIEHHENQYFIGPDSAEEYFDSAYVTARQQMFGFTQGQTYTGVIDEGYINSRLDDTLFVDSSEAQSMINASLDAKVAFQIDPVFGDVAYLNDPFGNAPRVAIGTAAEFGTALKVNGLTKIDGDLDIVSNGVLKFNGVTFQPTTVFTDDISGYVYYNGPKNIGIGTLVPTTELDVAGTINAEALQVNGVDIDDIFDSDFVRDRQILIDSALTTALIDSDYVRARADSDYVQSAITSDYIKSYIDSDYIKLVADSDYIQSAANQAWIRTNADSDYVLSIADSDYIKTAANQTWIRTNADSDYIKTAANQTWIRTNADSDYIQSAANQAWIRTNADSAYILSAANPAYILSIADSDYVKTVVDSAYTQTLTGIGIRDVDFGINKITYRNAYTDVASFPTANTHGGMFALENVNKKPYVSTGSAWNRIILNGDSVEFSDLIVTGDLTVLGTRTVLNTQTLSIDDPMIHLGKNNELSDAVDIGFIGHYSPDGGTTKEHTGFFRDATNSEYYIFNGLDDAALDDSDPTATVNRSGAGFTLAALNVGSISGQYLGFDSDFGIKTTTDLTEGSNLYYTTTRANTDFDTRLATKTTTDLTEGSNLYYTNDRVTAHVDSAYVQARIVPEGVDSAAVEAMVDSAYVQLRSPQFDYLTVIDSAYVQARQEPGTDSAAVIALINANATLDSAATISLIDSAYINARVSTVDSAQVLAIVDSDYILSIAGSGGSGSGGVTVLKTFNYIATAGQTTFEDSDLNSDILEYTVGSQIVTANGITLTSGTDYTATSGSSIVFATGRDSDDEISIITTVSAGDAGVSGSTATSAFNVTSGSTTTFDQTLHNNNFKSVEYVIHMDDSDNNQSQISKVLLTYNKSNVFTTEYGLVNSYSNDSDMGEITAVATASMIQLQLTKSTGTGTVAVKTTKTIIS
jgi:hypothetical protein